MRYGSVQLLRRHGRLAVFKRLSDVQSKAYSVPWRTDGKGKGS